MRNKFKNTTAINALIKAYESLVIALNMLNNKLWLPCVKSGVLQPLTNDNGLLLWNNPADYTFNSVTKALTEKHLEKVKKDPYFPPPPPAIPAISYYKTLLQEIPQHILTTPNYLLRAITVNCSFNFSYLDFDEKGNVRITERTIQCITEEHTYKVSEDELCLIESLEKLQSIHNEIMQLQKKIGYKPQGVYELPEKLLFYDNNYNATGFSLKFLKKETYSFPFPKIISKTVGNVHLGMDNASAWGDLNSKEQGIINKHLAPAELRTKK